MIYFCTELKIIMITNMESVSAYEYLQRHEVKPSVQRLAVMDFLLKNPVHPTVESIYEALSADMPTLSKTTVYNTLRLLVEKGAVRMLTIDERSTCFDAEMSPHSHFLCTECGRVYDVFSLSACQDCLHSVDGHDVSEVHTYYRGVCRECKKRSE